MIKGKKKKPQQKKPSVKKAPVKKQGAKVPAEWLQEDFKPQLTGPKGHPDEAIAPETSKASVKDKEKTDTSASANQIIVDMKPNTRTR